MPDPTAGSYDLPRLREQIRALFSDGELRDLCMDLDIDYEELPGAAEVAARGLGSRASAALLWAIDAAESRSEALGLVFAAPEFNRR